MTTYPIDAQGDRRLAGREHLAVLRADRRFLPSPPARGEGDRRRRGGADHQGSGPGPDRPADPRGYRAAPRPTRSRRLAVPDPKVRVPVAKRKGPRYTPVSRRQDRPNAILWLLRNHPELKDAADHAPRRHHQADDRIDQEPQPLERQQPRADGPGHARPLLADRPRLRGREGGEDLAAARRDARGSDAAPGIRDDDRRRPRRRRRRRRIRAPNGPPNARPTPSSPS